jgi:hypothetical protein
MHWLITPWVNASRFRNVRHLPNQSALAYKELYIIASYRIVFFNLEYTEDDGRDNREMIKATGIGSGTQLSIVPLLHHQVYVS